MSLRKIAGLVYLVCLLAWGQLAFAQSIVIQGKVIDAKSGNPLIFANIIINGGAYGTTTDIDGEYRLTVPSNQIKKISFSYIGYQTFDYPINTPEDLQPFQRFQTIRLVEKPSELAEVVVESGENPANRIIREAVKNRKKNDPEKIASFQYNAYHKFLVTIEEKSTTKDTAQIIAQTVDSSEINLLNHLKTHHLFIAESITERKYIAPDFNKETVLANRIGGLKNPGFIAVATDFQPFSFYKDFIPLMNINYLNPVSPGSTEKYFFAIEDTTYYGSDTVFIISFEPYPDKNFDALAGMLYINTNQYAIQNVVAYSNDPEAMVGFKIEQRYEKLDDYYWFPVQFQADIVFNEIRVSDRKLKGFTRTYLKDIQIHPELRKKEFDEVTLEIDTQLANRPAEYWQKYRVNPLEPKDMKTYTYLDSLGIRMKMDKIVKISEAFSYGRYPIGKLDLDLTNILKVNRFEGLRLGAAFFTNHRWSERYTLGAYAAYGTKDGRFKYGFSGEVALEDRFDIRVGLKYKDDVLEPANVYFLENRPLFGNQAFRYFLTERMDKFKRADIYAFWRPMRDFQMQIGLNTQEMMPLYDYHFQALPQDELLNRFRFSEFSLQVYYARGQEYIGLNKRKLFVRSASPIISFNYIRGGEFLGGKYDYHKLEGKIQYNLLLRSLGASEFQLEAGMIKGDVPYSMLYQGRGLTRQVPLTVDHYFQTMELYEFLSDRYVYLFYIHHFGQLLYKSKSKIFKPELSLAQNIGWGNLSHPESHQGIDFNTLDRVYYESGLLINHILRFKYLNVAYMGLGAGVYFRYGAYARDKFRDNAFFKITTSFSFR